MPKCDVAVYSTMLSSVLLERHIDTLSTGGIFSNSVRRALVAVLGESGAASLSYYMDLGSGDFEPAKIKKGLREIIGDGAEILERAIVVEFFLELNLPHEATSMSALASPSSLPSPLDFERLVGAGMKMLA
jgi:hypothetical protein